MLLFGSQMVEFAEFGDAVRHTATIVTTGEPKLYERQTAVDPRFAGVWHWTLVLIMFLVLTNTALAILVEAYEAAIGELQSAPQTPILEVFRHTMAYYARRVLRLRSLDPQASEPGGAVARRATSGGGAAAASGDDDDAGGAESGGRGGGTSGGGGARGAANGEAKQQGGGGEWGEAQELREAAHPTPQKNGEVAPLSETASGNGGARAQY